jgi:hypothetical protein
MTDEHTKRSDAAQRLAALHAEHRALWPDRDDPAVLSELTIVESRMLSAQQAITNTTNA